MDAPPPAESSRFLNPNMVHTPREPSLATEDDPSGKLLIAYPFAATTLLRPIMLAMSIVAICFMCLRMYNFEGITFIFLQFAFIAWTIACMVTHQADKGRVCRLDFGACTCICYGADHGDDEGSPKPSRSCWSQPVVDFLWGLILLTSAIIILTIPYYFWTWRAVVIVMHFVMFFSQVIVAILGCVRSLRHFKLYVYQESDEETGAYRIRLPRTRDSRGRDGPISVVA